MLKKIVFLLEDEGQSKAVEELKKNMGFYNKKIFMGILMIGKKKGRKSAPKTISCLLQILRHCFVN